MKCVSFKNFRRFKELPSLDFAPITILVGENNAGKSTVVKAILSILEYLNGSRTYDRLAILDQRFYFNKSYFAHVGTFKRALYNNAEDNCITLSLTLDAIQIELEISGDLNDDEAISGHIDKLRVKLLKWNIDLICDLLLNNFSVCFNKEPSPLFDEENFKENANQKAWEHYENYFRTVPDDAFLQTKLPGERDYFDGNLVVWAIYYFTSKMENTLESFSESDGSVFLKYFAEPYKNLSVEIQQFLSANRDIFLRRFVLLGFPYFQLNSFANVEYIYAHAVTQSVIYSAKDTNDYLVKTIHEFANLRIGKMSRAHKFIVKWMKDLNIGEDYKIVSVGGEAHIVKILSADKSAVNLADKGMGSIQLMILLFRLATKIEEKISKKHESRIDTTIIIEEPEQNLHPELQSKLADLFYELNKKYGFKFLIETHSEYLIRKTQIIVNKNFGSEEKLKDNPFKIYYFPHGEQPYSMIYRPDGKFENSFGTGFFDEAIKLAYQLFS